MSIPRPKNYPSNLRFHPTPLPSNRVSLSLLYMSTYCTPLPPSSVIPTASLVSILPIDSPSHPANGQRGLFARRKLEKGTQIVDYSGVVHLEAESDPASEYDICIDSFFVPDSSEEIGEVEGTWERISIDAQNGGNEARFVNDYRGVPGVERPNCEFRIREVDADNANHGTMGKMKRMCVVVCKKEGIKKGEELLVSYGKGFWRGRLGEQKAPDDV
ncbi:hypothetical protein BT69DRAFT_1228279 [Atractiella rhizophila]|nr:hypothetical protein BT69DRAFT_1228279 [Atractiella rhizophila]